MTIEKYVLIVMLILLIPTLIMLNILVFGLVRDDIKKWRGK